MATAIPITTDTLPGNVPKLDIKGANWAIFSLRFRTAVEAKELWSHFDGTSARPVSTTSTATDGTVTTTPPDANEFLTPLPSEYGVSITLRLRTKFLGSQCPVDGDVRQFLDDLRTKRDELAAVGVQIEEKDYRSTIIQSLPKYLASFASGQLATARLYSQTKTIDPDILISARNRRLAMAMKPWLWLLGIFPAGGEGTGGMDDEGTAPQDPPASMVHVGTVDRESTSSLDAPNLISQRAEAPLMTLRRTQLMRLHSTRKRREHFR